MSKRCTSSQASPGSKLLEPPQLCDAHAGELLLPAVEGLFADLKLATDVGTGVPTSPSWSA